jgi:glycosyltransferase involved in cell wall biosynthesis
MKLRIGFNARALVEAQVRGLSRYTANLLKALSREDDLELFLFSDREPAAIHLEGVRSEVVVVRAMRETLWEAWALPQALRRCSIDVFHAPADRGLPLVKTCPNVVTVHDSFERMNWRTLYPDLRHRYWYWKNELSNRMQADAVITVSDTTRRALSTLGIAPERKLHRIHLAAAPEFSSEPSSTDTDTLLRHDISSPYLLYVGGYDERKNVDALVRAFEIARLPEHCLVIAARRQRGFEELFAKWKSFRCFSRLRLIEPGPSEIPSLYRRAQFFVNPSLWESFSFQLVEAMACGTPLLASDRTAIPEIAGDAAVYIDPTNIAGFAEEMEHFADDLDLRVEMRRKGFSRVLEFSWDRTAYETIKVYQEVDGKSKRAMSRGKP